MVYYDEWLYATKEQFSRPYGAVGMVTHRLPPLGLYEKDALYGSVIIESPPNLSIPYQKTAFLRKRWEIVAPREGSEPPSPR
jgi:hypothetical protein